MSKIRAFFYVFKNTLFSPSYYADVVKAPFSFSFKFFIFYFFLYAVVGTTIFYARSAPKISRTVESLPQKILQVYPDELKIILKDGKVSTNVEEPYFITIEQFERPFREDVLGAQNDKFENILVIDTKASVDDFANYKTAALLTKSSIAVTDDQGYYKVYPLNNAEDFELDKKTVADFINLISPYLTLVMPMVIVSVFMFLFLFIPSILMTYLFFLALVIFIIAKMMKTNIAYWKSYQMGLHLVVITATLFGLLSLVNVAVDIPFSQTILLSIYSVFALKEIKKAISKS